MTESLSALEQSARRAVRELSAPVADPGYRERLRQDFTSGRIAESAPRGRVVPGPWIQRSAWRFALVPAAAAALVVTIGLLNRGPAWEVLHSGGDGVIIVDQQPIPARHVEELEARLRPGARLRAGGAVRLEIVSPGRMVVELTPGTEMTIPGSPGRWFARATRGEVRAGEIRITTGPAFRGTRLSIETPEAAVEVTGTTLAVIREPGGTCVCVLDGAVRVGPRDGDMADVTHGMRRFVFNDGREPELAAIRPTEDVELAKFRDQHRPRLAGKAR